MTTKLKPQQPSMPGALDLPSRIGVAAEDLKKISAALKQATKPAAKHRTRVLELLQRAKNALANCTKLENQCQDALARYADLSDREWSELDARIKEICSKHQWRIDGSWPSYMIAYGVQIEFDAKAKTVSISGSKYSGNDLPALEAVLDGEIKNLIPINFAPQEFLEALAAAYQDAKSGSPQAPVLEIYKSLVVRSQRPGFWRNAKNDRFVGLSLEQFRARISKTLEANVLKTKSGRELRFYPPLDPKDALFLFNPLEHRLGFVGRIEFSGESA
ncbi:MAG: hypothetical protein ACREVC_05180 [Burkholderiales bacterium]